MKILLLAATMLAAGLLTGHPAFYVAAASAAVIRFVADLAIVAVCRKDAGDHGADPRAAAAVLAQESGLLSWPARLVVGRGRA